MTNYRYNIFISSTFRDMDAERDVIKYNVLPLMNERYRKYGVEFHVVDLRFGVNTENMTEEDSENAVLDVCLSMIDSSRPFFIGLIGDRYGWIPQDERMMSVLSRLSQEKRRLVVDGVGCSVTELEILYGAIGGDGENIDRCLFFIRDSSSYEGISEASRSIYVDGFNDRLDSLKTRVHDLLSSRGKQDSYVPYSLTWDRENECFAGLGEFGDVVLARMCAEIDAEIEDLSKPLPWYEHARRMTDFIVRRNSDEEADIYDMASFVRMAHEQRRILISGSSGSGKSVLLSQIRSMLRQRNDIFPLMSVVGSTPYVKTLNNILYLWIIEMEQDMSLEHTPDSVLEEKDVYKKLHDRFYELTEMYKVTGKRVLCLIDGMNYLSETDHTAADLLWMRPDMHIICTCDLKSALYDTLRKNVDTEVCLDRIGFDFKQVVVFNENSYGIMLPQRLEDMMAADRISPMHVHLFMKMVSNLTVRDFKAIRASSTGSEIEKINGYIINLYESLPKDLPSMFISAVEFISERMAAPWLKDAVLYLASSGTGLRKEDIALLAGREWDELRFTLFMNMFDTFFTENSVTKLWSLHSGTLSDELASETHRRNICRTVAAYEDGDSIKRSYLAYYTVLAADHEIAQRYLCTEDAYAKTGERGFWSSDSVSYIQAEQGIVDRFDDIRKCLPPSSWIRMLYAFVMSLPLLSRDAWFMAFAPGMSGLEAALERKDDLYALATVFNDAAMHAKYRAHQEGLYEPLIDGACAAYRKCHEIDPAYADVRNMYKVAMMCKADILCDKGDFDGAMAIYQSLDKI